MNIKINHKMIKEMCGTVSFKRGDAFYRANKVKFHKYTPNDCEATVSGIDDFDVKIEMGIDGRMHTNCSCPALTSFQQDCQHIAAVLLAIYEYQRQGTTPILPIEQQLNATINADLTEDLLSIFDTQPQRVSRQQLYFENRKMLNVEFTCEPISINKEQHMLGVKMKIGPIDVENILEFLEEVKAGKPSILSDAFTYNPDIHYFETETDAVIQKLIKVVHDEKSISDKLPIEFFSRLSKQVIVIPPSSWEGLKKLLSVTPYVKLAYNGKQFDGLHLVEERLPIQFDVSLAVNKGYKLKISGMEQIVLLDSYHSVFSEGKLIQLKSEDSQRLSDLKRILVASGTNKIPIPPQQIGFFKEKVIPGLNKLGAVILLDSISDQLVRTPLIAKLYLDRVKNRLLAGLEFHYENLVINPVEKSDLAAGPLLIRDTEKEEAIVRLIEDSSFAKTDGGYFLHNEELEYQFLYHVVPKLQKLVQIYATTAVRNRIFKGNFHPQVRIKHKKERTNWLEFTFEMDRIPEKEIRDVLLALEEKRKFYRLRNGSLLSLETTEFSEIYRFLNGLPNQGQDLASGIHLPLAKGLQLFHSVEKPNMFNLETSFRQLLVNLHNPEKMEFIVPEKLAPILRDYQKVGFQWMKTMAHFGFGGILADDMGLGKTLQSITFIQSELSAIRKKKLPVLIVCPSSLTYNWLSELMKFTPELNALVVDGPYKDRTRLQKNVHQFDLMITSYNLLLKDKNWYEKQPFHTVFFDEAQAFKNPNTQTAKAVKRIKANHRFALTGTPVENSQEELWSIFHVVFPELFKGLKEYSHLPRATIARRIRPFLLRRLKEDVLPELPEKIESVDSIELLPEQKKLYGAYLAKLRHETLKHLDKDTIRKNRIKILAGLTRLRQICCHPALFVDGYQGSSAKFEQLKQIVEESQMAGRRVLIFSQFTKMLNLIGRDLSSKGHSYFYLDGQTPSEERVEICNRFNAGERNLFLISLKAGGTGLNLTGADTVILYDIWWNPAVEEQAADRAHRMGQKNVVQVIKLVTRGTIEEKINELQEKKRDLIEEIIKSEGKTPSSLTDEDIRDIMLM